MTSQEEADRLLAEHQAERRRTPEQIAADPMIRVGIQMPASVYQRIREFADRRKTSISKLCRDGACRELLLAGPTN